MRPLATALRAGAAFAVLLALAPASGAAAAPEPKNDMLLQADQADYDSVKKIVTANGHVEIDYDGRILLADSITYNQNTDVVTANGHVTVMDQQGNVAFAERVTLTDKMRDGALEGFGALLGTHGRLVAASAQRKEGRYTIARHIAYTPCKICNKPGQRTPVWQIKAARVVHDQQTHHLKFYDATIDALGVPILYTPYLTEPDPTVKHASGFLLPDVGWLGSNGYFVALPYYWSMSKSRDLTVEPIITTLGGDVLVGEYRERWNNGGMWLQGSVAQNPNGGQSGESQKYYAHLFGSGRAEITNTWRFGYDAQLTSNDTYLKRYNLSQLDRLVSDLFVDNQVGRDRFAISGYFFQGLRATDYNKSFPIPLPLVEYTYIPDHKLVGGRFRFDLNGVALSRDTGTNDQRLTAEASWRLPYVMPNGMLWTFQLDSRGDLYHTDTPVTSSHYVYRGLPYAALDWRWPFIASSRTGKSVILEPIVQLVAQPYGGNPVGIPNEDSGNIELDENNIFSFDQVPGYDVVLSGPRANVGLRAESRFESGYVEALVGQTFRSKAPDTVFAAVPGSGFTGTKSDLVGRFSIKFPPYLDLTNRLDVDERTGNVVRDEVYVTGTYGRSSTRISYIQLSPSLGLPAREEVNAQFDINFYRNWQGFAAIRRDLKAGQTLDDEFGIGYEDECLGISVGYHQKFTSDRDLPPSSSYVFRIKLKTTDEPVRPFSLFPEDVFQYGRP